MQSLLRLLQVSWISFQHSNKSKWESLLLCTAVMSLTTTGLFYQQQAKWKLSYIRNGNLVEMMFCHDKSKSPNQNNQLSKYSIIGYIFILLKPEPLICNLFVTVIKSVSFIFKALFLRLLYHCCELEKIA